MMWQGKAVDYFFFLPRADAASGGASNVSTYGPPDAVLSVDDHREQSSAVTMSRDRGKHIFHRRLQ
jgi:hypothetical protein